MKKLIVETSQGSRDEYENVDGVSLQGPILHVGRNGAVMVPTGDPSKGDAQRMVEIVASYNLQHVVRWYSVVTSDVELAL